MQIEIKGKLTDIHEFITSLAARRYETGQIIAVTKLDLTVDAKSRGEQKGEAGEPLVIRPPSVNCVLSAVAIAAKAPADQQPKPKKATSSEGAPGCEEKKCAGKKA